MTSRIAYDEFSMFHENAAEFGLPYDGPPVVRREFVDLGDGRRLSALVWGEAAPELVLLHGGAQNAHTWDTVAMALGRPLLAVDLPGHGHSDGGRLGALGLEANAADVVVAVRALAPDAQAIVGMSLGGMTTLAVAALAPDLTRRVVLVDVTPGTKAAAAAHIVAFIDGPETFASFDEILARTVAFNPTRSESSLRRGILHNAEQLDDGSWVWRHARHRSADRAAATPAPESRFGNLWDVISSLAVPLMLVRGMAAGSVVDDDDEAELRRRQPSARVEHVHGAGHSVQGDAPLELARLIGNFVVARQ